MATLNCLMQSAHTSSIKQQGQNGKQEEFELHLWIWQTEHDIHGARYMGNQQEYCLVYITERNQE